eukprot:TRINITY_DN4574_c0_g1_i1.p1 TRINITY_DN4574_c0_g1~~TRINITY_DN4574_c0_g1_i1.p1  ORF type:complete len:136 (-),score=13.81 TRINITY_DN4574_c0_g1_i1:136-507(-)
MSDSTAAPAPVPRSSRFSRYVEFRDHQKRVVNDAAFEIGELCYRKCVPVVNVQFLTAGNKQCLTNCARQIEFLLRRTEAKHIQNVHPSALPTNRYGQALFDQSLYRVNIGAMEDSPPQNAVSE